ncbi:batten's disease protein Cln3 [Ascodesmis nigricans]|uniref:Protein BTN n=1 Tax=Ascodesmis nigricans TaxID=341454 RepID=A0A4S2MXG9_9PEZI|nr:batten's disease protein Cln3 [Ascodesmis nigricans]
MEHQQPPASAIVAHSLSGSRSPSRHRSPPSYPTVSLPLPGSPASSWRVYRARIQAAFAGADLRVCAAFWLFGLINNVLYVIILSAALDLVGPELPKAIVLLADVFPSLFVKLFLPYVAHRIPYRTRILIIVGLSFLGMQLVAWCEPLSSRLFGVVLASVSSGLGELSFLGMTHYYGPFAVPFWGSGTGAAGLLGAGLYVLATSWLDLSVRGSLMTFGFLPVVMLVAFFAVLPRDPLRAGRSAYTLVGGVDEDAEVEETMDRDDVEDSLLSRGERKSSSTLQDLAIRLQRARSLFWPYILPLLLVYIGEYTINLGVSPTLLFPLPSTPFTHYRDFYPFYNTLYQLGVFISRSSTPFIRIHALYPPALLQLVNLALLTAHALWTFIPNVYVVFAVVFWEGLLGGAVYVNTFAEITEKMEGPEREFALAACTVGDSAGICVAGFVSLWLEPTLCGWQVARGREYCTLK